MEKIHRIRLDRQLGVFKKLEILHPRGIGQVDEDANPLTLAGIEGALQKGGEVEGRKNAAGGLLLNGRLFHGLIITNVVPMTIHFSSQV